MLKIGDFSKLSRISIRMLRHYDEIGLLIPESIDSFTGYRFYSEVQLTLANRIQALKDMGFGLSVIAEILRNYENPQELKRYLMLKQVEMIEQADKIGRQMLLLETTINRIGKDEEVMQYDVTLREMPRRYVASLRKNIASYEDEGVLWEEMKRELDELGVKCANPCYGLAVFYDEGFKESDIDVELQLSAEGSYQDSKNIHFKTIEPIQIASATYQGRYEQLVAVNTAVVKWISDNQFDFDGPSFCIYHVSQGQTQNPDEFVSEVCFPVKKK